MYGALKKPASMAPARCRRAASPVTRQREQVNEAIPPLAVDDVLLLEAPREGRGRAAIAGVGQAVGLCEVAPQRASPPAARPRTARGRHPGSRGTAGTARRRRASSRRATGRAPPRLPARGAARRRLRRISRAARAPSRFDPRSRSPAPAGHRAPGIGGMRRPSGPSGPRIGGCSRAPTRTAPTPDTDRGPASAGRPPLRRGRSSRTATPSPRWRAGACRRHRARARRARSAAS